MKSSPRRLVTVMMLVMLLCSGLGTVWMNAQAQGPVRFYYFYDPTCHVCQDTHERVIEPLLAEYGSQLEITELNIAETANMGLLLAFEAQHQVSAGDIPEVVIGEYILVGAFEIEDYLGQHIKEYMAQGGVELPLPGAAVPQTTAIGTTAAVPTATETAAVIPADCDECGDTHAANRTAVARNKAAQANTVRAILFWSERCQHCHTVMKEILPPLYAESGDQLEIRTIDIGSDATTALWHEVASGLGVPSDGMYVPMLIIGQDVLIGSVRIQEDLAGLVEAYGLQGGVDYARNDLSDELAPLYQVPETGNQDAEALHAVYFYQPGCDVCDRAEHDLRYVLEKYPQLVIERYDVKKDVTFNQYICQEAGVPEEKHLTAPALFIGKDYLLGTDVRAGNIEAMLEPLVASGSPAWWSNWELEEGQAQQAIVNRFQSLGILTVFGAGLLDGVNPCAFATMIFLISYLSLNKRKGKQLLATGAAFTLGVFMTYLGVGFGFLKFLASLPFLNVIGKWVYGVTAVLCLALAWGSIADYRKARAGRLHDMGLTLPDSLREFSKKLIRQGTSAKRFVLSAFLLGIGVSLVELACTGQVYLPTIIYVLGVPALKGRATLMLLIYNVMFIAPLICVFLMVYFGTTSQQLVDWLNRHAATVKLGMAALFVSLSGWLIYSIVAL